VVKAVLRNAMVPVVLDADGINLLREHRDVLRGRTAPTILTPHAGEYKRFAGDLDPEELARELGCILLMKGHRTRILDGATCYINTTGNPGMAVGGSGDLLAGMIVSLLGQGIAPMEATAMAAWLHGAAGDLCAERLGQYAMLPTDMLESLPRLLK
jgi:NAD(P)H-hydrate epimerase